MLTCIQFRFKSNPSGQRRKDVKKMEKMSQLDNTFHEDDPFRFARSWTESKRMQKSFSMDNYFNGDEPPPSLEEIRSWGKSFEKLMENPVGRKVFEDYLKTEYSDENIHFWEACEDLKKEQNPKRIEEKARLIYKEFVSRDSPTEVNLDAEERRIVERKIASPTANTYDEAQELIYTTMKQDSYFCFLMSPFYKSMCETPPPTRRNRKSISKGRRWCKQQTL